MSARSDERHRVGLYLCSDLACVARSQETPGPDNLPERLAAESAPAARSPASPSSPRAALF